MIGSTVPRRWLMAELDDARALNTALQEEISRRKSAVSLLVAVIWVLLVMLAVMGFGIAGHYLESHR